MNFLNITFNSFLVLGFFFQSLNISLLFFKYDTVTKILIFTPHEFDSPDLAACFNYADLLNLTWFNRQFGTKVRRRDGEKFRREVQSMVSFEDIFKHTPNEEKLIDRCSIRFPSSYASIIHNRSFCKDNFFAKKFIQQEFVCYHYSPKETFVYDFSVISYAPEFSGKKLID